jgi:hypothetical protein
MKRLLLLLVASTAAADDVASAAAQLGVEFREIAPGVLAATLTKGLATCDRIDLEVRGAEVTVYPRMKGQRLDPRRCADRAGLLAKLGTPGEAIAPLAWVADAEGPVRATASGDVARALLAARALDKAVADLLPALKPALSDEEVNAKLREAGTAEEAKRNEILAGLVAYLPEVAVSPEGQAAFEKIVLNARGAKFDAFRFRVPVAEGDRRLMWAFGVPTGKLAGWFIAPVEGEAPKFVKFHRGGAYAGVPEGYGTVLQRTETPLRGGAEYVLWFQFKVDEPVDFHVALTCVPHAPGRDQPSAVEKALGLKPPG